MSEKEILWCPRGDAWQRTRIGEFVHWLGRERELHFSDYEDLWRWSTEDLSSFWSAIWEFSGMLGTPARESVVRWSDVGDATWFEGARLNYAQELIKRLKSEGEVIIGISQSRPRTAWTRSELESQVSHCRAGLLNLGVAKGDRVAAFLPNIPETIAAFLAVSSLGAIWSSCPPEFGVRSVIDRFRQIEPKLLLVVDGYQYGDRKVDLAPRIAELQDTLPSLQETIVLPYLDATRSSSIRGVPWEKFMASDGKPLVFESVPFDHPLYILYSSGTTGLPKAIVHGHGGILLEHFKNLALHLNLGEDDRFFWFTTTGWMMWNLLISGLLVGSTIVTFDGNPSWPFHDSLWGLIESEDLTFFGVSATFLSAAQANGAELRGRFHQLRSIGSTGSTLSASTARWIYSQAPAHLHLGSGSGGTDVCSGFVGAVPLKPVLASAMSCRYLGAKVEAFDENGRSLTNETGELVITRPMPSMPVALWNDPERLKLRSVYFSSYPGIWRHGDWITIWDDGTCAIHGRSDATLNRGGVRLGSAEFYALLDALPEIQDSLIVHVNNSEDGPGELILLIAPRDGTSNREQLKSALIMTIRSQLSPRHVPDTVYFVSAIPRTLSGKRLEVPVKNVLRGAPLDSVISAGAVADLRALDDLQEIARSRSTVGNSI
jgi:acetoacetyl-CoA synthetase